MKLQTDRACGTKYIALPLAIVVLCLFGQVLSSHYNVFREYQATLLSADWVLLASMAVWCGTFIFLTFNWKDWPLIGLLAIALAANFIGQAASPRTDQIILLAGMTLGNGTHFLLKTDRMWKLEDWENSSEIVNLKSAILILSIGLIGPLAFSSCWHLDMVGAYHGPRWMGLWNNPNIYGMLMGAGGTLAIGLLAANAKLRMQNVKINWFLGIAVFMLGVGLVMSYSRGAWLATIIGLLYLAWAYGKFKWRWVLPVVLAAALVIALFWHSTADTAPWYLKRLDFSRPSAQHRVSAWRGALQMMRDHPLGVGWNQAVSVYDQHYSPPEDGAAALTMNSYLMLGTELGLPGLLCFVAYVGLCFNGQFKIKKSKLKSGTAEEASSLFTSHLPLQAACRAGALVFVVAFWFDGGLFDLPTAAMFWVLLELGASNVSVRGTA
jgi:O-antigen ligase